MTEDEDSEVGWNVVNSFFGDYVQCIEASGALDVDRLNVRFDSEDISCEKKVIDGTVTSVDGKEFCYNVVFTATLGDLERIYYVNYVNVQG